MSATAVASASPLTITTIYIPPDGNGIRWTIAHDHRLPYASRRFRRIYESTTARASYGRVYQFTNNSFGRTEWNSKNANFLRIRSRTAVTECYRAPLWSIFLRKYHVPGRRQSPGVISARYRVRGARERVYIFLVSWYFGTSLLSVTTGGLRRQCCDKNRVRSWP